MGSRRAGRRAEGPREGAVRGEGGRQEGRADRTADRKAVRAEGGRQGAVGAEECPGPPGGPRGRGLAVRAGGVNIWTYLLSSEYL